MVGRIPTERVVAVQLTSRGFGFAVLEGPGRLIDWGTKEPRDGEQDRRVEEALALAEQYSPEVLLVENVRDKEFRHSERARDVLHRLRKEAPRRGIRVRGFSRAEVRAFFFERNVATKRDIALCVADQLPELAPRLPPKRKPWMSQDARMSIFDAVAMALAYYDTLAEPTVSA